MGRRMLRIFADGCLKTFNALLDCGRRHSMQVIARLEVVFVSRRFQFGAAGLKIREARLLRMADQDVNFASDCLSDISLD